tara:strand:- start:2602 stop:2967 length:366 start_codon:yes stop_codon:yes gene_type:complete
MASIDFITNSVTTSSGVQTITTVYPASATVDFYLENVTIHLSTAASATMPVTMTLDAGDGAVYDTKLLIYDFYNGVTYEEDLIYQPEIPLLCKSGDSIEVKIVTDGSAGMTVSTRIMSRLV